MFLVMHMYALHVNHTLLLVLADDQNQKGWGKKINKMLIALILY